MAARLTSLFPLLAVLGAAAALTAPRVFAPLRPHLPIMLGAVMLAMGLTLQTANFRVVLQRPRVVVVGLASQFMAMPALALVVSRLLRLPEAIELGLVAVGCCPGGTASNVVTFLARGNVALSVTLTGISTLLSVVLTPGLIWLLAGHSVHVPVGKMLVSVVSIVLLPVLLGVAVNTRLGSRLDPIRPWLPAFGVAVIVLIIAVVVALTRDVVATLGPAVLASVALHNIGGLCVGYGASRVFGFSEQDARTVAIEVGMQNSGLGVTLATQYFGAAAALPGAAFSVWHNLTGSTLASFWSRRPPGDTPPA